MNDSLARRIDDDAELFRRQPTALKLHLSPGPLLVQTELSGYDSEVPLNLGFSKCWSEEWRLLRISTFYGSIIFLWKRLNICDDFESSCEFLIVDTFWRLICRHTMKVFTLMYHLPKKYNVHYMSRYFCNTLRFHWKKFHRIAWEYWFFIYCILCNDLLIYLIDLVSIN